MSQSISHKRPWFAALLAAFVTGLGHLYLRRWRRALGWLVGSFLVTALFVDPTAVDALMAGNGGGEELLAVAPMFLVVAGSVVDAYFLARSQNAASSQNAAPGPTDGAEEETVACPHCGKEVDPDLEFCHWCTRSIEDGDRERLEESTDR